MIYVLTYIAFPDTIQVNRMRGRLVNWMEKDGLENIRRLLEITEVERNHELLLMARNL